MASPAATNDIRYMVLTLFPCKMSTQMLEVMVLTSVSNVDIK